MAPGSIYGVLHRECFNLFPDEMFADLFTDVGRRSVPPMIVAVVMVLQRIEGLSDREAVDRLAFDVRWKYAAGGLDFDYPGFVHTVLVDMRARLVASQWPDRIFEVTLAAARQAGLVGRRRVLDSTPLYDAVAMMDTVTLIRSAIRGLLRVADAEWETELRGLLRRDDDYVVAGKPVCDWDDRAAREALVDALAGDARACWTPWMVVSWAWRWRRRRCCWPLWSARTLSKTPMGVFGDRAAVRQRPGRVYGGPRRPAWAQDLRTGFRRLQGPRRHRPGQRDYHRHHRHRG